MTTLLLSALGGFFVGFAALDLWVHEGHWHPLFVIIGILGGGLILAAWSHLEVA